MEIDLKILNLFAGIIAGIVRVILGYLDSGEPFDKKQFASALVRTTIMAALLGYGLNQDPIMTFFEVYTADSILTKAVPIVRGAAKSI